MADELNPNAFLAHISLHLPGAAKPIKLGGPSQRPSPTGERTDTRAYSLATEAMRWTYVLRARQRWLDQGGAPQAHEQAATETLMAFGLSEADLQRAARAERVVVRMPYFSETEGWAGRIFPWEYVIAAATRRFRRPEEHHFTVMRELDVSSSPRKPWAVHTRPRSLLFVQSAPGALATHYEFDDEHQRIRAALPNTRIQVLKNPTWQQLHDTVANLRPDLIHMTGFDNVQGLRALREIAPLTETADTADGPQPVEALLRDERGVPDGFLLAGERNRVSVIGAQHLAQALGASGKHCAYFIAISVENSAARTAALLVAERAALTAVGFQDAVDNTLADYFFELVYTQLGHAVWDLPLSFEQAWLRVRQDPQATRATGIALWAGAPILARRARSHIGAGGSVQPSALPVRSGPPRILATPETELNYAVLHNNGKLFKQFVVERVGASDTDWLSVDVELQLGTEKACFSKRFQATQDRFEMSDEIHVPLTASLVRAAHEAVNSSLVVQLTHNHAVLTRDSHRLRLLPVDQWRDNAEDGQWLPSFVLPRDPAVMRAVEQAQRYVRVLRDNPDAGFEGYQVAHETDPTEEQLREVDLQVQAIWATLVHEWQLGYINPPPGYSKNLDSQRLRTPSNILHNRSGTCIDLALLFAACLELIDVYPVIFLFDGHALPGYWRHQSYQRDYGSLRGINDVGAITAQSDRNSSSSTQTFAWQARGKAAHREILQCIRARQLVPVETVRLTEHSGFVEAIEAGIAALDEDDFHSVLDIVTARGKNITPLPISGESL